MYNLMHLRYALEIESTGSISKAAKNLYMTQPQLSRALKELEDSVGCALFNRTAKGVIATDKGADFLAGARSVLSKLEEMEMAMKPSVVGKQDFLVSVPRAGCYSYAFDDFLNCIDFDITMNLTYRETNAVRAIKNVCDSVNDIAFIRFRTEHEKYFLREIDDRGLGYEPIHTGPYVLLVSKDSPIADMKRITMQSLESYCEIIEGDYIVPYLPIAEVRSTIEFNANRKTIAVFDRDTRTRILRSCPETYAFTSPVSKKHIEKNNLAEIHCDIPDNSYCDLMIFRKSYRLNHYDREFVQKVKENLH
ncbi:MAG: LysR family transcriptional regulator [Ruminococcaceae bacterium]|nr:LysR family transcriptional regulator [Oscillospiraceae bacterium]